MYLDSILMRFPKSWKEFKFPLFSLPFPLSFIASLPFLAVGRPGGPPATFGRGGPPAIKGEGIFFFFSAIRFVRNGAPFLLFVPSYLPNPPWISPKAGFAKQNCCGAPAFRKNELFFVKKKECKAFGRAPFFEKKQESQKEMLTHL